MRAHWRGHGRAQTGVRSERHLRSYWYDANVCPRSSWDGRRSMGAKAGRADEVAWHAISVAELAKRLATDTRKGVDTAEAEKRLQKYGANRLPEGKKRGPFMRLLSQFNNILVYV